MSQVEFEEENINTTSYSRNITDDIDNSGFISKILIKLGIARDEKIANYIMIILVIIFLAITIFLFVYKSGFMNGGKTSTEEEMMRVLKTGK